MDEQAKCCIYLTKEWIRCTHHWSMLSGIRIVFFSETNSIDSHVQFAKFWKGAGRGCVTWETYLTNTPFFDKSLTLALKDHMPLEWPKNVGQRFWISLDGEKWGICVKFKSPQAKKKCTMQFKDKNASDSKHDWKQFPSHRRYGNT